MSAAKNKRYKKAKVKWEALAAKCTHEVTRGPQQREVKQRINFTGLAEVDELILGFTDFFTALRCGASDLTLMKLSIKESLTIRSIQEARSRSEDKTEILLSNADKFLAFCFFQRNGQTEAADDLLCRAPRFNTRADLPLRRAFNICDCKYAQLILPEFRTWATQLSIYAFALHYNILRIRAGLPSLAYA